MKNKFQMRTTIKRTIYTEMQRLAEVTKSCIVQGNIERAKKCISAAEHLYNNGTTEIKNAISNVFLFSLTTFMEMHHCSIKNLLPASLINEYKKQINSPGS